MLGCCLLYCSPCLWSGCGEGTEGHVDGVQSGHRGMYAGSVEGAQETCGGGKGCGGTPRGAEGV